VTTWGLVFSCVGKAVLVFKSSFVCHLEAGATWKCRRRGQNGIESDIPLYMETACG